MPGSEERNGGGDIGAGLPSGSSVTGMRARVHRNLCRNTWEGAGRPPGASCAHGAPWLFVWCLHSLLL